MLAAAFNPKVIGTFTNGLLQIVLLIHSLSA